VPLLLHSHQKPSRGVQETRPAEGFLQGVGINSNVPGNGKPLDVRILRRETALLEVERPVTDMPRLLALKP